MSKLKCFVMMPSGAKGEYEGGVEESDFIFEHIIKKAVIDSLGELHTEISRETDSRKPGAITHGIVQKIAMSDICIVDGTKYNPNVWLELGIRYALKQSITILMMQEDTIPPFDTQNYKVISYSPKYSGISRAIQDLSGAIREAIGGSRYSFHESVRQAKSDSLVFDAMPQLKVDFGSSREIENRSMSWDFYWRKIEEINKLISDKIRTQDYTPKLFVGITNGGGMFSDLLTMQLKKSSPDIQKTPLVTLWADRTFWNHKGEHDDGQMFNNPVNLGIFDKIKASIDDEDDYELLLLDDNVASGYTQSKAIHFLSGISEKVKVRYIPMFNRNRERLYELYNLGNLLWNHPAYQFSFSQVEALHETSWISLPYQKEIRTG